MQIMVVRRVQKVFTFYVSENVTPVDVYVNHYFPQFKLSQEHAK